MRIIFFGTPDFAVASLQAIIENGFNVVAVVTAPDKPAGRGMQLQQSPVKKFAVEHQLPVLQPGKLKDPVFINDLKSYNADIQVIIAFRMLPEIVWNMPRLGTINLHASLLPDYRGAAPINWAIINGEKETGVSTFFLKHEIDTGDLLLRDKVSITSGMNAGELHDILMNRGASLIVKTLKQVEAGTIQPIPQRADSGKLAPKLFTEDCRIDWNQNGENIVHLINGLSPYPGAFTTLNSKILKIYSVKFIPDVKKIPHLDPGTTESDSKTFLRFKCLNGWIEVADIQLEGKKRMPANEFLKGYKH